MEPDLLGQLMNPVYYREQQNQFCEIAPQKTGFCVSRQPQRTPRRPKAFPGVVPFQDADRPRSLLNDGEVLRKLVTTISPNDTAETSCDE